MQNVQLAESQAINPALLILSSAVQSERAQLLAIFTAEQITNFTLDNTCDFELVVHRSNVSPRQKQLEEALLMPFRTVEEMVKSSASDFGNWRDFDFLSELSDQLDYLQSEPFTLHEAEVICDIAKDMYLSCSLDIAPILKKHAVICNQFLASASTQAA